jgi:DNA-binding NtrC family response regulator
MLKRQWRKNMEKRVILISKKSKELNQIDAVLSKNKYRSHRIEDIENLDTALADISCTCVILDLDSISIDNRTIRELTIQYPHIYFLCMSKDRFHPELKDAICYHIFACLTKPLDYDELLYWLRCIDNEASSSSSNKEG